MHSFDYWNAINLRTRSAGGNTTYLAKISNTAMKLAKSILATEDLPQDLLTESPVKVLIAYDKLESIELLEGGVTTKTPVAIKVSTGDEGGKKKSFWKKAKPGVVAKPAAVA